MNSLLFRGKTCPALKCRKTLLRGESNIVREIERREEKELVSVDYLACANHYVRRDVNINFINTTQSSFTSAYYVVDDQKR